MKRLMAILLILSLICLESSVAFAISNDDDATVVNLGVGGDIPDSDPENDAVNESKLAQMAEAKSREDYRTNNENVLINCPTRPQITTYWCGLASAEQVIRASGNTNNLTATYGSAPYYLNSSTPVVTGTYHQFTIANYLGVTGAVEANQIAKAINHFSTGSYTWKCTHIPGNGTSAGRAVLDYARQTIDQNGKCCVVFADTKYYSYYSGHRCYHWVTLNGYSYHIDNVDPNSTDPLDETTRHVANRDQIEVVSFKIVDPHYSTTYQGPHSIGSFYSMGMAIERTGSKPNIVR